MTRAQLWGLLDGITPVEPVLLSAYEKEEEETWKKEDNSPHSSPWHVSFHGSSFPGYEDSVCGRAQVYTLMNPASEEPIKPWLKAWFDLGSNLEHDWVRRLAAYGVLLSADVTGEDKYQTNFEDPEVMLTGSPDVIMLPPFWNKSHVAEVKTTSHEKVMRMLSDPNDTPYSHEKYMRQLGLYIGEAHDKPFSPTVIVCEKSGVLMKQQKNNDRCSHRHSGPCLPKILKIEPPDDGTLIYSSREEPLKTVSYYCQYDKKFMESGKEKLSEWKNYFDKDEIPPHVREKESAKWSEGECQFCTWKKPFCKQDYKNKTKKLSESALIDFTKTIRPQYDPIKARQAVLDRWKEKRIKL